MAHRNRYANAGPQKPARNEWLPATLNTAETIVKIALDHLACAGDGNYGEQRVVLVSNAVSGALLVLGIDEPPMDDVLGDLLERVDAAFEGECLECEGTGHEPRESLAAANGDCKKCNGTGMKSE
jgi:hypothetical protein